MRHAAPRTRASTPAPIFFFDVASGYRSPPPPLYQVADRLFGDLSSTWNCCMNDMSDVKVGLLG